MRRVVKRFHFFPKRGSTKIRKVLWMGVVWSPHLTGRNHHRGQITFSVQSGTIGFQKILQRSLHKQIVGHFQQQRTEAPFSEEWSP